ncbi:MAG TPA: GMC family oxidoreductase [Gaiellaceae bacterium]|nr:GMC family oxidoreductase [Gaiellaceae bacterium]
MPPRFDVVVLGGGTAGCVLAARLSEDRGRKVGLVEAGPEYGPYAQGRWPEDLLDARWLALESHCWETAREDRSQLRARVLGGCSAHNACVILPGTDEDYDEWGEGWDAAAMTPYLERAERAFGTRVLTWEELSPWHRAFAEAAGGAAIVHPVNARGTLRWSAAFAYLDQARGRENLTILADTVADRVLFEGDSAVGVATTHGPLSAQLVVLAAGAYGSPAILLRSGLSAGEGLVDHVGAGIGWEPTDRLREDVARFEAERPIFMAQVTVRGSDDSFIFPALEPGAEISGAAFAMKPRSRGSVRLTSRDPGAPLEIEHGFLSDHADLDAVVRALEDLRELVARDPIAGYVANEVRPGFDVDLEDYVRENARGFFHPVATCAIGRVVDREARVLGYENLYVADASIMPTIPRANTNLSTAAVAERVADLLRS